jgi:hypothetical protein
VTRPPILASEALREEVAPLEPSQKPLRLWLAGLATCMALSGLAVRLKLTTGSPEHEQIAYAVAAIVFVALIVPYRVRGILVLIAGIATIGLGLFGRGPLSGVVVPNTTSATVEVSRVLAATVLPAALLFRARYRAYGGARIALIFGLVLAVPATVHAALVVASGPLVARMTSGMTILAVLASCIGFMGAGTTGASTAWAVTVLVTFGIDISARGLWMDGGKTAAFSQIHAGLAFVAACSLVTIGLFKLLATTLARDARMVDVLGTEKDSEPMSETGEGSD